MTCFSSHDRESSKKGFTSQTDTCGVPAVHAIPSLEMHSLSALKRDLLEVTYSFCFRVSGRHVVAVLHCMQAAVAKSIDPCTFTVPGRSVCSRHFLTMVYHRFCSVEVVVYKKK